MAATARLAKRRRAATVPEGWSLARRRLVSLVIGFHLLAVFLPPFAFQTSPVRGLGSPLAETGMSWFRPYIEALYLTHGYAFFAPDPGPSHLLVATLEFDDGRTPVQVTLPDIERDWPRLLYHRHFMLSEHLNGSFAPSEPPPEATVDAQQMQAWRAARELYLRRRAAIEHHLKQRFAAASVELVRVEHRLLDPIEFLRGETRIDDAETYLKLPEEGFPESRWPSGFPQPGDDASGELP